MLPGEGGLGRLGWGFGGRKILALLFRVEDLGRTNLRARRVYSSAGSALYEMSFLCV